MKVFWLSPDRRLLLEGDCYPVRPALSEILVSRQVCLHWMINMTPGCFPEKRLSMKRISEILPGKKHFGFPAFCVVILLLFSISGCTTEEGTRVSSASLLKLKTGVSTMADVRSALGPPDRVEKRFGEQVWIYRHRVIKGLFYRRTTGNNIAISFDEKGVIRQVRSSSVDRSEAF